MSSIDKLVVARHGRSHPGTGRLTEEGANQMRRLAALIKPHAQGINRHGFMKEVHLLTSTAPRAMDSSEILMQELGLKERHADISLWSDNDRSPDDAALLHYLHGLTFGRISLVVGEPPIVDVVILVTHLEYATDFPIYYGKEELGVDLPHHGHIDKGCGQLIHCLGRDSRIELLES